MHKEERLTTARNVAEQLAGARCVHDLDHQLRQLSETDWRAFVAVTLEEIAGLREQEPDRATHRYDLLREYMRRRQYLMGEEE